MKVGTASAIILAANTHHGKQVLTIDEEYRPRMLGGGLTAAIIGTKKDILQAIILAGHGIGSGAIRDLSLSDLLDDAVLFHYENLDGSNYGKWACYSSAF